MSGSECMISGSKRTRSLEDRIQELEAIVRIKGPDKKDKEINVCSLRTEELFNWVSMIAAQLPRICVSHKRLSGNNAIGLSDATPS